MFVQFTNNLNIDVENASSWFIISTWSFENRVGKNFEILLNFPCLISILSLIRVTVFEISARLNLFSVPLSSLLLDIGHLEKSFRESIM